MTTPNQAPPDIASLVGMGAFQVGNAAQNWGQTVTETIVRDFIIGPAFGGINTLAGALDMLKHFLLQMPLEALKMLQHFIPGLIPDAFVDIVTAVDAILDSFSFLGMALSVEEFLEWVGSVFSGLASRVVNLIQILLGITTVPLDSELAQLQNWAVNLGTFLGSSFSEEGWDIVTAATAFAEGIWEPIGQLIAKYILGPTFTLPNLATAVLNGKTSFDWFSSVISDIGASAASEVGALLNWLRTVINQITDIFGGLSVTPFDPVVLQVQDWFTSLTGFQTGTHDAISSLGDGLATMISGLSTTGTTVQHSVDNALDQFGQFLNQIQQGVTGAVNSGQQATSAAVQGALGQLNGAVNAAQAQVAQILGWLQPKAPAVVVGGPAPTPAAAPTSWGSDWTVTGTAAASATVTDTGFSLVKSGSSARKLIGINNTKATESDYQSIRFLMKTSIETPLAGGSGVAGNGLIFRCDSASNPQNYGELRLYYDKIELWAQAAGVTTLLNTWTGATTWGSTYSLDVGTANGLNKYQLRSNGIAVGAEYTDTLNKIQWGSGFRKGGQSMYTAPRGATETAPGVVMYWKLASNPPNQKVGSGFKVCRVSTTGAAFAINTNNFPANFYDTVDRITPDYTWNAATSTMTVRDEGWYVFKVNLPFLNSSGQFVAPNAPTVGNGSKSVSVAIAVDGVIDSFCIPCAVDVGGVEFTTPATYCQAGSEVVPVYSSLAAWTISGGYGSQTAFERTQQYFSGHKLGQVVIQ